MIHVPLPPWHWFDLRSMASRKVAKNLRFANGDGDKVNLDDGGKGLGATPSICEHTLDDVQIDMPKATNEGGHKKPLPKHPRSMQSTRKISSRVHKQRDIVWQVNGPHCGVPIIPRVWGGPASLCTSSAIVNLKLLEYGWVCSPGKSRQGS